MQPFPSTRAYVTVAAIAVFDALWIALTGLELPLSELAGPLAKTVALAAGVLLIAIGLPNSGSEGRFERISVVLQGLIFLQLSWITLRLFNHVTMATGIPLADAGLARLDALLGFDWNTYFHFVQDRPWLIRFFDGAYTSLTLLSAIAFFFFMLSTDLRRAQFFLEAFLSTAVVCIAIGMFFPAEAAVVFHGVDANLFRNFSEPPGVYHMKHLEALRGSVPVVLNIADMPGLVTFPSFHTAAGIVLVAAAFRTPGFWPAAIYSTVMIASTPVLGGHYFVDLIAGGVVAALVVSMLAHRPEYAGLFSASRARKAALA